MWRSITRAAVAALSLAMLPVGGSPSLGQEKSRPTRGEFMRQKLEYSKRILEGLTVEDYELIRKSSRALRMLSQASEWEVPTLPDAKEYIAFTGDFQRLCDELGVKAKEKNIDGATLSYLRLTMNCVACHKYVRYAKK